MKKFLLIFLILVSTAHAIDFPEAENFVTDTADMISPQYEGMINNLAMRLERNTTVEIAVFTVESLEGLTVEQYAVELFEKVGIGKKDLDNGLLILVAEEERKMRIEVGYGLEGIITDAKAGIIIREVMTPKFKEGNYGEGIYTAVVVISELVQGNEEVISQYSMPQKSDFDYAKMQFIIYLIILLIFVFARGKLGFFPIFFFPIGGRRSGGHFGGGFSGGGFGGFGGGFSGGGGASGGW